MKHNSLTQRLAVCSWSLQPATPEDLVAQLQHTGLCRVQIALDPLRDSPEVWGETKTLFSQNGLQIVSGMFGCVGEDYSTPDTIRATGGLAPDATWEQNWRAIQASAALAQGLGLKLVSFHAGFLPPQESHPNFAKMQQRLDQVALEFETRGIALALETGQETAPQLLDWLQMINRPNLGINFDPANLILYDQGDPLEAMRTLGPWIRQVHIKDAVRTKRPGAWGQEVAVGAGEVDWPAFFATLHQLNFAGDIVIEREAGRQRAADIRAAREIIERAFCSPCSTARLQANNR